MNEEEPTRKRRTHIAGGQKAGFEVVRGSLGPVLLRSWCKPNATSSSIKHIFISSIAV
jgi:hypothetical protein